MPSMTSSFPPHSTESDDQKWNSLPVTYVLIIITGVTAEEIDK